MRDKALARFILGQTDLGVGRWFWVRFLDRAAVLARARGPRWSRTTIAGCPLGAWVLATLWLGVPLIIIATALSFR